MAVQESKPERPWQKTSDESLWEFRNNRKLYGSPMFDAIRSEAPLDAIMMLWLRARKIDFEGPYDTKG